MVMTVCQHCGRLTITESFDLNAPEVIAFLQRTQPKPEQQSVEQPSPQPEQPNQPQTLMSFEQAQELLATGEWYASTTEAVSAFPHLSKSTIQNQLRKGVVVGKLYKPPKGRSSYLINKAALQAYANNGNGRG